MFTIPPPLFNTILTKTHHLPLILALFALKIAKLASHMCSYEIFLFLRIQILFNFVYKSLATL